MESRRFNRAIKSFLVGTDAEVAIRLKLIAVKLLSMIISHGEGGYKHPVDTGRARAGWYPAARRLNMPWSESGRDTRAIADGKKSGDYGEVLFGPVKWIDLINAVHYILYLEYGWSNQALLGMVRLNMRKLTGRLTTGSSKLSVNSVKPELLNNRHARSRCCFFVKS